MNRFDNLPDINSFKHLHEAVSFYTGLVVKSFRCNDEEHKKLMEFKAALHERIDREQRKFDC